MTNYKLLKNKLINIPIPSNITYMWNYGSILLICFITQLLSGLMLTMYYLPMSYKAFDSIFYIMREPSMSWFIRLFHCNMASMYFLALYLHLSRNLFIKSFFNYTWMTGSMIFLLSTMTAFLGYVLPWGQMSYWGAMVITNLLTSIPYIGNSILTWIWGNFTISSYTLTRFYLFHFILPFIIMMFIILHIYSLHLTGSSNPLGMKNNDMISFHPYFTWKDIIGFMMMFMLLMMFINLLPFYLLNPENFNLANPLLTPPHIEPEWYFLYAYTILRSIPNKLGGTIALFMSILMLFILPLLNSNMKFKNNKFFPINNLLIIIFYFNFISLTMMGMLPIENPFYSISQILSFLFFLYFLIDPIIMHLWYKMM
uniref:Cytochrome b n=2 Tax=Xenos TaxID=32435 RepID=A0A7T1T1L0_9NEOP|nr:cytochrome b [Xenos yangi]QPP04709.1 cytochrome b [Xenos cf. moutoni RZ-2020]UXG18686.1 cytochrome b [Xenos yangi]